jgi:hypothetical protein
MTCEANDLADRPARSPGAERMARHRHRRRTGLRCLTIELRREEITWLIRHQWLAPESRHDLNAVKRALYTFFDEALW